MTGLPRTELLPGHPVARARDVDEAHEAVTRTYLPHRLEVLDRAIGLDMRLNAVRVGAVTAGYLRYGSAVRLGTVDAGDYHVNIPVAGRCEQRCGSGEPVFAGPGRAAVFMPGHPADLRWEAACAQLCLMIDRHELELELRRQLGRPLGERLRFTTTMDLGTPAARSWLEVLALLEREADRPGGITHHPAAATHLQSLVITGLLLAQPNNYSDHLHAPAALAPPRALRRAVELIEDDPGRPWTSGTLAREAAVSVRSLQEGFQRWFGLPPMAYLRDVRLTRVQGELAAADPAGTTIAAVAARWGFLHAGRFATAYRRKFGVLPSETLHGRHAAASGHRARRWPDAACRVRV
ncbi:AraC family transcriptional regulator [Amycolatopsis sp., V23-08]|uniref:AraC family transcriptional regulator n=1 Tax=Amycolatopsis heterodermiae TaxID=3110235 RepID=A0ABU5RI51_9PSEU|nr:AraC family transcriptional regulator [Amycolatopsis sp., V23-08]MEA5365260.1 AraC family transcriptional regulator [Amycolatopsis sp., V23-08]